MHAGVSPSRGLAAGVAIVISLSACGTPPPDAATLLKQSSQRMLGLTGFHFQMQISGFTGPDEPVQGAQGDAHPPGLHARVNLKEGGILLEVEVIFAAGNIYLKSFTGGWQQLTPDEVAQFFDARSLFDPDVGLFLASLDAYVVVTALLPMLKSVNIAVNRPEQATPIITGFLLGYLAIMPVAGGLSDRFGRLRLFAACLVLFAFGSFLTATAPSLAQLVTGRVLQGAGGGALVPAVLALAADLYPAGDRSPVLGAVSALQEIGSVLGPLWGGLITASS